MLIKGIYHMHVNKYSCYLLFMKTMVNKDAEIYYKITILLKKIAIKRISNLKFFEAIKNQKDN